MYEISIKHKGQGKVTYNVYTKDEADKENVRYTYWKKAEKANSIIVLFAFDGYL